MNKLKLHDLHQVEISKQEQGMLKGGNGCGTTVCDIPDEYDKVYEDYAYILPEKYGR